MSDRREPVIGEPSQDADPSAWATAMRPARTRQASSRRSRAWWIVFVSLLVLAAAGFALVHWRSAIGARLVPVPQQNQLVLQAQAALRAGRLTSPDGRGARELFEAAMARNPDDLGVREGLTHVASAAAARAQSEADAGKLDLARRDLALARDLSAPVAAIARVEDALRRKAGSETQIAALLDQADAAAQGGHLDDGDASALALYQQAVALAPDNALVLDRRAALLSRMLGDTRGQIAQGRIDDAQKVIDRVAAVDPGHLDLPDARARLADALQRRRQRQSRQMDRADADMRAGRIDAAAAIWKQTLEATPDDPRAHAGLRAAAEAWVREANRETADFQFPQAAAALEKARELAPDLPSVRVASQRMRMARLQRSGLMRGRHDKARIADLLAAADNAMARGELVEPPGDSAFDKLHEAAAIAPGDPRVVAANHRFVTSILACYQRAMTDNHLVHASDCLDALISVQPGYATLPSLRSELAKRWLGYADERLGAGEIDNARKAVDAAHRLTPRDPAVAAMDRRVRLANGGR
ncbi:MAG: hypothetical protein JSR26_03225 [Proteobacteria bacterium]|nr:hypothetical protein [Pseudomonadota bacterium]